MKQFWNFKDGEDYMRQHFDNVPGLKEAGGLNFLKKHGVWPIYGKLDPKTGKVADKTGREIKAEYGLFKKELSAADMTGAAVGKDGLISQERQGHRRQAQRQELRRLPHRQPHHQRARRQVGRVRLQPDAHLQAHTVARDDEGRRTGHGYLQTQCA
jgi:hypothetical protein